MEVSLMEMLEAREKRAWRQRELLRRGRTVICFTMNIAGPIKNSPLIGSGYDLGKRLLLGQLDVAGVAVSDFEEVREKTGNECILLVDAEPLAIKAITAELEDHAPIGRLFDMDVLRPDGSKVVCARSRKHSVEELQAKTREILREAVDEADSREAARYACQALLYEVAITPKPGLVDRENSGSHRDMDFFTFQASAAALQPYFAQCVRIGRQGGTPTETLRALRLPGKLAEAEMRRATVGVNTHKGAIFSMGILCGALGRLDRKNWADPDRVLEECAAMAKGIVSEDYRGLTPETAKTAGQKLYILHGITGVRGQAEAGFPAVREVGLPALYTALGKGMDINDAGCAALLELIVHTADTNMIHRGGYEGMLRARLEVKNALERDGFYRRQTLEELDAYFIENNLSPGGSADLLALTLLLFFLKEHPQR